MINNWYCEINARQILATVPSYSLTSPTRRTGPGTGSRRARSFVRFRASVHAHQPVMSMLTAGGAIGSVVILKPAHDRSHTKGRNMGGEENPSATHWPFYSVGETARNGGQDHRRGRQGPVSRLLPGPFERGRVRDSGSRTVLEIEIWTVGCGGQRGITEGRYGDQAHQVTISNQPSSISYRPGWWVHSLSFSPKEPFYFIGLDFFNFALPFVHYGNLSHFALSRRLPYSSWH